MKLPLVILGVVLVLGLLLLMAVDWAYVWCDWAGMNLYCS